MFVNQIIILLGFFMAPFRWPSIDTDIKLAVEVAATRPEKPAEWEAIATRLSAVFSSEEKTVDLKGRGCKNRMERLLAKYKAEDARNLKRFANAVPKCLQHCVLFYKQEQKNVFSVFVS